jgi:aconitase A
VAARHPQHSRANIQFPIIADMDRSVARLYGVATPADWRVVDAVVIPGHNLGRGSSRRVSARLAGDQTVSARELRIRATDE